MALTKKQLQANADFFERISKYSNFYFWSNMGFFYEIEGGSYICADKVSFDTLKHNTPKSFHNKIKMKVS